MRALVADRRVAGVPRGGVGADGQAADEVAGLRGAARLAAALAAERALGDAALAALRRDAPVLAARRHARGRLALAARRHPQPRGARGAARLEGAGPRARAGRALAREAARAGADAAARVARAADADPGPPLAAHVLPLAAPGRDPGRGAGDLRHSARRSSATCAAPSSRR